MSYNPEHPAIRHAWRAYFDSLDGDHWSMRESFRRADDAAVSRVASYATLLMLDMMRTSVVSSVARH